MFDQIESIYGKFAIPHLVRGIVVLNALCFLLVSVHPSFVSMLTLEPDRIASGEWWRMFTYAFIPQTMSWFWIIFALLFLWMIGEGLEKGMGSFRLNMYFFIGLFGTGISAFLLDHTDATGTYLHLSLLFAFAALYPNYEILLFFIIPFKMKWLAIFSGFMILLHFFASDSNTKLAICASLANFLLFFGPMVAKSIRASASTARETISHGAQRKVMPVELPEKEEAFHSCAVCGRTEITDPSLSFRVADDEQEYCAEHLPKTGA